MGMQLRIFTEPQILFAPRGNPNGIAGIQPSNGVDFASFFSNFFGVAFWPQSMVGRPVS
jgi:hypothetical protein